MNKPQTIQIFLPDGNPRSVRIAEITNRVVKAILVPRNKMEYIATREELRNVGIYFLFGISEEKARPKVYIGEAEDCLDRLKSHNRNKEFWSHAVVMISKINAFTKSHVKYLESISVEKAKVFNRFDTENMNIPTKSHVTESMEADLLDSFETIGILLSTLGYPVFDDIRKSTVKKSEILYLKGKGYEAEGDLIDDGFVIFKGSKLRLKQAPGYPQIHIDTREELLRTGALVKSDDHLILQEDLIMNSPSRAAGTVMGSSRNGWITWKDKNGKTLDELKRQ